MTKPLTPDEIAAIRARVEKASPGPWEAWCGTGWPREWAPILGTPASCEVVWPIRRHGERKDVKPLLVTLSLADQDFVTYARTDIPRLLDTVEALQRRVEAAEEAMRVALAALPYHSEDCDAVKQERARRLGCACCFKAEAAMALNAALRGQEGQKG